MDNMELDNLSKDEMFQEIKDKCKSRAKATIYQMLVLLIIVIVYLIISGRELFEAKGIIGFILWTCVGGIAGCLASYKDEYKKEIDRTNAPGQLLQLFKRNLRIELICIYVLWLLLIADCFVHSSIYSGIVATIALVVNLIIALKGYGYWPRRDKEIIEQLQELDEKE